MTQNAESIELGKKICLILSRGKGIGDKLNHKYQGGGNATHLKIVVTHGDEKPMNVARKFLTEELNLSVKQEPHHGKGGKKNTFLVPLFGIKEESLEKINSLSQEIIKKESSNGSIVRYDTFKKVEPCEKEVAEQTPPVPIVSHKREMSDTAKYKLALSRYLRPIMEMEGVTPHQFPFDREMKGGMITIQCQNGEIAKMIEISISYTSSFPATARNVVGRDGSLVMVDGSKFYELEHKPFAFPPKEGQSLEDVKEKIQSLCSSRFSLSKDGKRLLISFSRETAAQRAYKLFGDLHWNMVGIHSDGKHIVFKCGYAEQKESETVPSAPASVSRTHYVSHTPYVSGLPSLSKSTSGIIPSSNDDIINELKSIADSGNLSPETMERIQRVLLDDIKKKQEEYAKILLAKLGY